ncbi:D-methionine transport system substrate-binding protein [Gracilibacillus halotolerans]|uniref:D-methionine transport system substrate-binding protein n=1 Tax=Gracilibacillus halotolerans TaxID=74386 RepID=A0A841RL56_9BACI|nr:MetQ/NlpA family ABC transporter substrate-binding protein [Gracilibacillus halotolerans]MBB6513491.1 D-methionine transport system substrate-binding protein [Gracilibacillus halotolerans]
MKKIVSLLILMIIILAACGSAEGNTSKNRTVTIAIQDSELYETIVEHVKKKVEDEGIDLEIVYMSDWNIFNQALANAEIDLNFYQTRQFLQNANETNGWNLVPIADTYFNNQGYFSSKYKTLEELPEGATVIIPSDPVNNGHALHVLQQGGLIKLKEGVGFQGSQSDIIENKKGLNLVEVDFNMIPNMIEDSDLSYLATRTIIQAGFVLEDALILGDYHEEFIMVLAAREDNKDEEVIQIIAEAFESEDTKNITIEKHPIEIVWH